MSLSDTEVKKIAHLARLAIDPQDVPLYSKNLSNILELVEQMNGVDTTQVNPMSHAIATSQRLRQDIITETDQRELFQSIAPLVEAGLYLVPKVIEEQE